MLAACAAVTLSTGAPHLLVLEDANAVTLFASQSLVLAEAATTMFMMIIAFITFNSSLVPLMEGL